MFNQLKIYAFTKKLYLKINEPIFKQKLDDLIPKTFDSNMKVHVTPSTIHINKKNNDQVDDLVIKINNNTVWYYYYSTGNFNEYGKLTKSKVDIATKYCHYDINTYLNRQKITTKTTMFIYDLNLKEIYRQSNIETENYIISNGVKQLINSNSTKENMVKCERQIKLKDGRTLNSIQIKYKNNNMKANNCEKYYISNIDIEDKNINKTKRLSKKSYLNYVKKNSINI